MIVACGVLRSLAPLCLRPSTAARSAVLVRVVTATRHHSHCCHPPLGKSADQKPPAPLADVPPAPKGHDSNLANLLENNKAWVEKQKQADPEFFDRLGQPQTPEVLYFGCSDSRVPANQILGLQPGEVFVHRNVGNLVPGSDINSLSVLEYGVQHLGVKHIIVTGHYDCGAINAAMTQQDHGLIEVWLRHIRDTYRLHRAHLDAIEDVDERKRRLVELNVVEQCLNLYKTGVVQRKRLSTAKDPDAPFSYPRIHAMVFDPKDGVLRKLPVSFRKQIDEYQHIYNLYDNRA